VSPPPLRGGFSTPLLSPRIDLPRGRRRGAPGAAKTGTGTALTTVRSAPLLKQGWKATSWGCAPRSPRTKPLRGKEKLRLQQGRGAARRHNAARFGFGPCRGAPGKGNATQSASRWITDKTGKTRPVPGRNGGSSTGRRRLLVPATPRGSPAFTHPDPAATHHGRSSNTGLLRVRNTARTAWLPGTSGCAAGESESER